MTESGTFNLDTQRPYDQFKNALGAFNYYEAALILQHFGVTYNTESIASILQSTDGQSPKQGTGKHSLDRAIQRMQAEEEANKNNGRTKRFRA